MLIVIGKCKNKVVNFCVVCQTRPFFKKKKKRVLGGFFSFFVGLEGIFLKKKFKCQGIILDFWGDNFQFFKKPDGIYLLLLFFFFFKIVKGSKGFFQIF
jgi:hypothetical protein